MAFPVYSERLVVGSTKGVWTYWTVPAGHRAIVRSVSAYNSATTAANAAASVGGLTIYRVSVPATVGFDSREFRHVAYAGETVGALVQETGMLTVVSGYVFSDTVGRLALAEDYWHVVAGADDLPLTE